MVDVLICSMPLLHHMGYLPAAPAILKSAVQNAGYTATTLDLNLEYFDNQCNRNIDQYFELGCVWRPYEIVTDQANKAAADWVNHCIGLIKRTDPKTVAVSVFTNWQQRATWLLLSALKQQMPEMPVIVGGFGCEVNSTPLKNLDIKLSKLDQLKPFWQLLKENNLIDHAALGGGGSLDDLVNFLDKTLKNIDRPSDAPERSVMYDAPIPDYNDYKLDQYVWENGQKKIAITGSKGCVRSCRFCDIPALFGKFKTRSGADIAHEMIHQSTYHGIRYFEFTDSLVNGSLKIFREWLTVIAEHNDKCSDEEKIHWFGQYICRPQSQTPSDIYDLMKRSGVVNLIIGVDSGSDAMLDAMNKKMTTSDVYDELEKFSEYGIHCNILMLSGYYCETWENFVETLHFLQKCQRHIASGTIGTLGMGPPLYINEHMYIGQHAEELGIILNEDHSIMWTMANDPENNYVTRIKRRVIAQLVLDMLGYALSSQHVSNLQQTLTLLEQEESKLLEELNETSAAYIN